MGILTPSSPSSPQANSFSTSQSIRNYYLLEPVMSKEEYWWNHLTFTQREWISHWYLKLGYPLPKVEQIYNDQFTHDWHKMEGWPSSRKQYSPEIYK